ncbi:MAG: MbcA/ParS/Xre antitoxin family protein [Treponema sp.]|jgi:putative toxin-antitoxin system antitoxin component (TIGR02293 family)|nr:MbcA/ParS/Xre antitoxin family protein [Treponema sp.]
MEQILVRECLSPAACRKLLEKGIRKSDFIAVVKNIADMTEKDFAVIAGVSQRTLSRLKPDQTIPPQATEVTLSVLRIYQKAQEVFGSETRAQEWMKRPNTALQGRTPVACVQNRFGAEEVTDVLNRIEYGVYS